MARTKKSKGADLPQPLPRMSHVELESEVCNCRKQCYVIPPLQWVMEAEGNRYTSNPLFGKTYIVICLDGTGPWVLEDDDGTELAEGSLADMMLKAEIQLHGVAVKTLDRVDSVAKYGGQNNHNT